MKAETALKLKSFASNWISKVVAKRTDYRQRLLNALDDFIPDDIAEYDPYGVLTVKNWDNGKYGAMCDILEELLEYDNVWNLSKKAQNDFSSTIRIAIDLYIEQSGGVIGFTVGDLRKVFDGNIPKNIESLFSEDMKNAEDFEPIWL